MSRRGLAQRASSEGWSVHLLVCCNEPQSSPLKKHGSPARGVEDIAVVLDHGPHVLPVQAALTTAVKLGEDLLKFLLHMSVHTLSIAAT